jgi:hypothetical protein
LPQARERNAPQQRPHKTAALRYRYRACGRRRNPDAKFDVDSAGSGSSESTATLTESICRSACLATDAPDRCEGTQGAAQQGIAA